MTRWCESCYRLVIAPFWQLPIENSGFHQIRLHQKFTQHAIGNQPHHLLLSDLSGSTVPVSQLVPHPINFGECTMKITNVHVLPSDDCSKVLAYASITIDACFVVKDLRIIQTDTGELFVAMPSRSASIHCHACHHRIPVSANFCSYCGTPLPPEAIPDTPRLFHDVAHPINAECRETIEQAVITAVMQNARSAHRS
ncbi:MAG: SpoVG family protein [Planctomycetaceae bacterium]|nr:SpoVG family protein [Planctomycetaceae bacterium]